MNGCQWGLIGPGQDLALCPCWSLACWPAGWLNEWGFEIVLPHLIFCIHATPALNEQILGPLSPSHLRGGMMNRHCLRDLCPSLSSIQSSLPISPWNLLVIPRYVQFWGEQVLSLQRKPEPLCSNSRVSGRQCLKFMQFDLYSPVTGSLRWEIGSHDWPEGLLATGDQSVSAAWSWLQRLQPTMEAPVVVTHFLIRTSVSS